MFASEPKLFSIGTINLPLEILDTVVVNIIQIEKTTKIVESITKPCCIFRCSTETTLDMKLDVSIEDKMYSKTYYCHITGQVQINETLAKIRIQ